MIRLTDSVLSIAAAAAGDVDVSAIVNLSNLIPNKGLAKPLALKFIKTGTPANSAITVTKLILRSTINPERQYQVYRGAGMTLDDLNDMLSPVANAGGPAISVVPFDVEHGLEMELISSNSDGSNAYTGTVLWKLANVVATLAPQTQAFMTPGSGGVVQAIGSGGDPFASAAGNILPQTVVGTPAIPSAPAIRFGG